jgi:hypothetical protein
MVFKLKNYIEFITSVKSTTLNLKNIDKFLLRGGS